MLNDEKLEKVVQDLLIDICEIMYRRGYDSVSVGAIMRLVGVANEHASKHDDQSYSLDDEFLSLLEKRKTKNRKTPKKAPNGATLH